MYRRQNMWQFNLFLKEQVYKFVKTENQEIFLMWLEYSILFYLSDSGLPISDRLRGREYFEQVTRLSQDSHVEKDNHWHLQPPNNPTQACLCDEDIVSKNKLQKHGGGKNTALTIFKTVSYLKTQEKTQITDYLYFLCWTALLRLSQHLQHSCSFANKNM